MTIQYSLTATKTEILFEPQRFEMQHTLKETGGSDVFFMLNPIPGSTFGPDATSDTLIGIADVRIESGDILTLDANVKSIWAITASDEVTTIEINPGTWSG